MRLTSPGEYYPNVTILHIMILIVELNIVEWRSSDKQPVLCNFG